MKYTEFLDKETPSYGGCMVCLATYESTKYDDVEHKTVPYEKKEYLLVERHKCANGDIWTINKRPYYDYDFTWEKKVGDWEILYKKEI